MKKIIVLLAFLFALNACSLKQIPENTTAASYNVQLGLGYLAQNERVRAKEKLLRALNQAPNTLAPHLALAYYYETVDEQAKAQYTYQHALKILPKSGQVNNNYGVFLCAQGDYSQALVYFERALLDPYYTNTASAYENTALCMAKMNNAKAANYAYLAVQQDPKRSGLFFKLSYLLAEQGETQQALAYLDEYHQLNAPTQASMALVRKLIGDDA